MHTDCSPFEQLFSGVVFKRDKKNRVHEWVCWFDERWTEQFPERLPEQFPECVHFGGKRQAFEIVAKTFKEYKAVHLTSSISILWIQWLIFTSKRFRKSTEAACSPRRFVMTSSTLSLLCAAAVLRDETSPVNNWSVMHAVVVFFFFFKGVEYNYLHFNTHRYQQWVLNKAFLGMFFENKFNCDTNTHLTKYCHVYAHTTGIGVVALARIFWGQVEYSTPLSVPILNTGIGIAASLKKKCLKSRFKFKKKKHALWIFLFKKNEAEHWSELAHF